MRDRSSENESGDAAATAEVAMEMEAIRQRRLPQAPRLLSPSMSLARRELREDDEDRDKKHSERRNIGREIVVAIREMLSFGRDFSIIRVERSSTTLIVRSSSTRIWSRSNSTRIGRSTSTRIARSISTRSTGRYGGGGDDVAGDDIMKDAWVRFLLERNVFFSMDCNPHDDVDIYTSP